MNASAQATTIDEVNQADVDCLQFLNKPVSNATAHPAIAFLTYLVTLSYRCRHRRDSQLLTQPLQSQQPPCRSTRVNSPKVGVGQSEHVTLSLLLELLTLFSPALRNGKLSEVFDKRGLRIGCEVRETTEIGLFSHDVGLVEFGVVRRAATFVKADS